MKKLFLHAIFTHKAISQKKSKSKVGNCRVVYMIKATPTFVIGLVK